jgi:hypothetical protein
MVGEMGVAAKAVALGGGDGGGGDGGGDCGRALTRGDGERESDGGKGGGEGGGAMEAAGLAAKKVHAGWAGAAKVEVAKV